MDLILIITSVDFELSLGGNVTLTSHGYPNHYPPSAYVLWTFQYETGQDTAGIKYQIVFKHFDLGANDLLTVGPGWNPTSTDEENHALFGAYMYVSEERPDDIFLEAGDIFIEFNATSYEQFQGQGFSLSLIVTGMNV